MSTQLAISVDHTKTAASDVLAQSWARAHTDGKPSLGDTLHASGMVLHFVAGREIYGERDVANVLFMVVSGLVRTCKLLSDGRRQIEAFHRPGDVFGFEAGTEYSLSAEAVCECTVIAYRRRILEEFTENSEKLSRQLLSYAMRNMVRAQKHSVLLGRRSATEKVAAFLVEWASYSPDSKHITLELTRQDIADYLGLTIETVSRTLSQLERDNLIALSSARQISIRNPIGLRDLSS